jgi:phosphonate transport system ATP-binding protein
MQTLAELNSEQGLTIITVLDDLGIAAEYAQRVIVLDPGRIVYDRICDNLQARFSQVLSF